MPYAAFTGALLPGTDGRLYPEHNYLVPRTLEACRLYPAHQSGKVYCSFRATADRQNVFLWNLAIEEITATDPTYFPNQLQF